MILQCTQADIIHATAIVYLVNSAYRGESGRIGWTTESDLLAGQRLDVCLYTGLIHQYSRILIFGDVNEPSACIHIENKHGIAHIGMVTVSPTKQQCGIGSFILQRAELFARDEWGLSQSKLTVISLRVSLISWYEKRGYINTGVTEAFPYGDIRYGLPLREDLEFVVLIKQLPR